MNQDHVTLSCTCTFVSSCRFTTAAAPKLLRMIIEGLEVDHEKITVTCDQCDQENPSSWDQCVGRICPVPWSPHFKPEKIGLV